MRLVINTKKRNCVEKGDRLRLFLWNGLLLTIVSLFMRFVGMSFQLFITEYAGGEAIGLYSVIGGVYGFAVTLATSGIQLGATRMVSEAIGRDDPGEVRAARRVCFSYAFVFGFAATLLLFVFAKPIGIYLLKDERTVCSLKILACSLLPIALCSVLNGYFTALRQVYKNALCGVLEQGVRIGITVMLFVYVLPRGVETACLALVLGSVLSELLSVIILGFLYLLEKRNESAKPSAVPEKELRTRLLKIAMPMACSAYVRSGLLSIEHMLIPIGLTAYFGDRSVALSSFGILQGVALPIVLFPSAILSSFAGLLVPEIAECRVRNQKKKVKRIVMAIFRGALLFSVGVSGIMLCFSYEIASMMENGKEAAQYLRLLAPLIPVMYLDTAVDSILKGHGEQVYCMQVNIMDSLLSVLLVFLLLPRLGTNGYILVIYIAELLNASLSIARLLKVTDMKPPLLRILFLPLFSVIGATAVVRMLASLIVSMGFSASSGLPALILHIVLSIVLYIIFLFCLGGVKKCEIETLVGRIRRKNEVENIQKKFG